MRRLLPLLAILACQQPGGLGKPDTPPQQKILPPKSFYSYRFTEKNSFNETTCDTKVRQFENEDQLCWSLQIDQNNETCALSDRQKHFKEYCGARLWDPLAAATQLQEAPYSFECYYSEKDLVEPIYQVTKFNGLYLKGNLKGFFVLYEASPKNLVTFRALEADGTLITDYSQSVSPAALQSFDWQLNDESLAQIQCFLAMKK